MYCVNIYSWYSGSTYLWLFSCLSLSHNLPWAQWHSGWSWRPRPTPGVPRRGRNGWGPSPGCWVCPAVLARLRYNIINRVSGYNIMYRVSHIPCLIFFISYNLGDQYVIRLKLSVPPSSPFLPQGSLMRMSSPVISQGCDRPILLTAMTRNLYLCRLARPSNFFWTV